MTARIQFILKARDYKYLNEEDEANGVKKMLSSGLFNSARFVERMLNSEGYETDIQHAIDNNYIDRLVTKFKPDICVIEAYWVVPEKFEILHKLHPKVKWVIRNHSAIPFIANEGVTMDWSIRYMTYKNVFLCSNDIRAHDEIATVIKAAENPLNASYLPNFYPYDFKPRIKPAIDDGIVNMSCFGALRPLKNHLMQAIAALKFADKHNLKLRFHINGPRVEMKGEPILNNIKKMFALFPKHELVEHDWLPHDDFIKLVRQMDVSLQVSYTETFNIVTADAVVNDVPVVTSPDISWINYLSYADPNDSNSIVAAIERVLSIDETRIFNLAGLQQFSDEAKNIWHQTIQKLTAV
jgi:glycosyltransferase involved in cell wall biosynthesis